MRIKHIIYLLLLIGTGLHAQEVAKRPELVPGIQELKIGDKVPDILIDKLINNDKRSIRTSDYKDKLLILDFWDTNCSVCISSMPKLDSLQREFGDKMKLLSVTWMPEDEVVRFFKTNRFLNNQKAPVHRASAVGDRILRSYFRHQAAPHIVWIYKGKVTAITDMVYVNAENIKTILSGKPIDWPLKNDGFDPKQPFLSIAGISQEGSNSPYFGYSVLTGQATSVSTSVGDVNFVQDSIQNRSRVAIFNKSIYYAYQILLRRTGSELSTLIITPSRRFLEVKDPSRYLYKEEYGSLVDWEKKNLICYELVKYGLVDRRTMAKLAIQDLNNRLGVFGRYEKRKLKCLVFVKTDKPITDTLAIEKGGVLILAIRMLDLDMKEKYPPVIDETGFTGGLNMQAYDGTIAGLRKEMQRHGLDLIEAERETDVLVISENDGKKP